MLGVRKALALVAFGAMGAASVMFAEHAHAEPVGNTTAAFSGSSGDHSAADMWVDISNFLTGTQAQAAEFAQTVCTSLGQGHSEGTLAAALVDKYTSVNDARYLVHAAEWHYCPEYY